MNVHVLVPFYRKYLYKTLIYYYSKMNIILHPICDSIDIEPFKDNKLDWVKPFLCPPLKKGEQCYIKFNYFIDSGDIVDDDYYGFVGDDDMYEQGIADELKKKKSDIIYNSNYRGDKIPNDGGAPHPTYPLIPTNKNDVVPGNIGLGMFFVKGHILKKIRFETKFGDDDGRFAQKIYSMGSVEFMPDYYVFGNYLQPGRHTDIKKFKKPSWELPKIITEEYSLNTFKDIFSKYDTDKTDNYSIAYEECFTPIRNDIKLIFEIGVNRGGSVKAFKEFFPNAIIVGFDINKASYFNDDRIKIEIGSASNKKFIEDCLNKYGSPDIVIDDGSHLSSEMKASYNLLYDKTKICYVMEDIGTQYPSHVGNYVDDGVSAITLIKSKMDSLIQFKDM